MTRGWKAAAAAAFATAAVCLPLRFAPLPPLLEGVEFSRIILDRNGEPLYIALTSDEKYRIRVSLHEVPQAAVDAVVLYEDRWFRLHPGVNPLAAVRAAFSMLSGSRRLGASTITMQVARIRYGLSTDTIGGKLRQAWIALSLEARYSKDEILEAYFNLAPYGGCVEGIGAAARVYFHRPAWKLTETESVSLAPVPQNPVRRSPSGGKDFEQARRRMAELRSAAHGPAAAPPPLRVFRPSDLPFEAPHAVRKALRTAPPDEKRIRTAIDLRMQKLLERRLRMYTERERVRGTGNAALMLVHAPTLETRVQIGSAGFFDKGILGQVDGTQARRSPGSTLKPFIYALALDQGLIHPHTLLLDSRRSFGGYDPENFDRTFRGPIHAAEALRSSRNIPAISLAARLKAPGLYDFLVRGGVRFTEPEEHYGLSLVLGGAETTMQELAGLYAMLLNGGAYAPPALLAAPSLPSESLLSPEAAHITLRMLEHPGMTLHGRGSPLPLRWKTGTSNGFRDAWCVGTVGPYVLAVWVGDFANRSRTKFVGGEHAVPLWLEAAESLASAEPVSDPLPPQRQGLGITELPVCAETGDTDISLCADRTTTLFIPGVSPVRPTGILRRVLVDTETGLRACIPDHGRTEMRTVEFWPTEYRTLFAMAGIRKEPPPGFMPGCGAASLPAGKKPDILLPRQGSVYYRRISVGEAQPVPFKADADADAREIFWFSGTDFLGKSLPGETLLRELQPGEHIIRAVDDRGGSSERKLLIRAVP